MGKLDDYKHFFDMYTERYGKQTVVLYQQGLFHEIYGVDNETEKIGNVSEIANLLGIKETRANTKILENNRSNPQMAGFNSVYLDERVDKLVSYGYTVVVVNQVPNTNPIQREVAYIESPSTRIGTSTSSAGTVGACADPYLVSVYMDRSFNHSTKQYYSYIGMAAIDVTTGESYYYESNSTPSDPTLADDDLTRFMQSFNPVEVLLNTKPRPTTDKDISEQVQRWGFRLKDDETSLKPTVFLDTVTDSFKMTKIAFQEEFLGKYFSDRGHLDPIEYIGMTQYEMARIAFIYLLDFCSGHNKRLLTGLSIPKLWTSIGTMVLDNSSIIQLAIIENYYLQQRCESVVGMLSRYTHTAMGRRLLRDRIINPIIDHKELQHRYGMIDYVHKIGLVTEHNAFYKIHDIDRLCRKLVLGTLTPAELHTLDSSLLKIHNILEPVQAQAQAQAQLDARYQLRPLELRKAYTDIIDIDEAGRCTVTENMQDSIFRLGYSSDIDQLSAKIRNHNRVRDVLCQKFSDLITPGSNHCTYKEDTTGQSCYCSVTKVRFQKLQSNFPTDGLHFTVDGREYTLLWTDLAVDTRNKSNVKITINLLDQILAELQSDTNNLRQLSIKLYVDTLSKIHATIGSELKQLACRIGELDLYCGMYTVANEHNYCKPELLEDQGHSCVDAVRLRHPLIERDRAYVPQTLKLGQQWDQCGILLYGVNQTGKSCTMKSVGVAVIMAQAGFYVPAESFRLCPFRLLTTRILGNDNISRGLSTFAVEMIELRSILTRCNSYSLNLGDEVCHGTESASAASLVAASIRHLSKHRACFIFATHLHGVSKMDEVLELDNVKHYHLTIDFDGDRIVYNRLMLPGSGLGLYGIEVAKHLKLPDSVLEDAYRIRNKYYNDDAGGRIADLKASKYNSKVVMGKCRVPNCERKATQTHHIRHQASGLSVDGMHKNCKDNLVPICDFHHDMTHAHTGQSVLVIHGYGADGQLECKIRPRIGTLNA